MKRQDLRRYAFLITFGRSLSFDSPEEALNNYLESFKEDYEKENGKFSEVRDGVYIIETSSDTIKIFVEEKANMQYQGTF